MSVLITVDELAGALESETPPVVLDVRWTLGGPPGKDVYLEGHIPGAVYVDMDSELAAPAQPSEGRHPLPEIVDLQESMRRWGLNDGDNVVAYDGTGNLAAARAWWILQWAGFENAKLLDGGLPAWIAAGHELATDDVIPEPGDAWARAGTRPVVTVEDVEGFDGALVDARAAERYTGDTEPIDPVAGHIPGAVNAPTTDNLDEDGRFLSPDQLRAKFADLGVTDDAPTVAYCGSGITAAHEIAALEIAGFKAALYPGSWSQWSNQDLPVETGDGTGSGDDKTQAVRNET